MRVTAAVPAVKETQRPGTQILLPEPPGDSPCAMPTSTQILPRDSPKHLPRASAQLCQVLGEMQCNLWAADVARAHRSPLGLDGWVPRNVLCITLTQVKVMWLRKELFVISSKDLDMEEYLQIHLLCQCHCSSLGGCAFVFLTAAY